MSSWMINAAASVFALLAATGLFFFITTRGTLIVRGLSRGPRSSDSHVYPIYSNMRLIKLVDFQPIISAILLFQYHRLVSRITRQRRWLGQTNRKSGAAPVRRAPLVSVRSVNRGKVRCSRRSARGLR